MISMTRSQVGGRMKMIVIEGMSSKNSTAIVKVIMTDIAGIGDL